MLISFLSRVPLCWKSLGRLGGAAGLILLCLWASAPAHAQLPLPRFDRIFPAGGRVGTAVEVSVQGDNFDDVKTLRADDPGLKTELVKQSGNQATFRVTIAPGTPQGTHDLRAAGRWGISNPLLFEVSDGLTEVEEKEPNDTPAQANGVPLNCVVNGRADSSSDDYFRWKAAKGQRVILDCWGSRLGSEIDPTLVLLNSAGKELAFSRDFNGPDPLLDFTVPEDGEYLVRVYDFNYTGGGAYRLRISTLPYLDAVFPLAAPPGSSAAFTLFGRNLPNGAAAGVKEGEAELQKQPLTLPIPAPETTSLLFQPASSVFGVELFQYRLPTPGGLSNPINIGLATAPPVEEKEPNDQRFQAQELTPPCEVNGSLGRAGDQDWFAVTLKGGQSLAIEAFCERMGMRGDLVVLVQNEKGEDLTELDDSGPNYGGRFNARSRDPEGRFTAPRDGKYYLLLTDRYQRGGARFLYRLRVTPPQPDYRAVVEHNTDGNPSALVVRQGGRQYYDMFLYRRDGFDGEIHYSVEGLPSGVTCPDGVAGAGVDVLPLVFSAAPNAPVGEADVRVHTWAMADGKRIDHEARSVVQTVANQQLSRLARTISLAVRPEAPFVVTVAGPSTAKPGDTLELKVTLQRLSPELKGDVIVNAINLPPNVNAPSVTIPAGKTEGILRVELNRNMRPGGYTLIFRGEAQVGFYRNPGDKKPQETRVADPANPVGITVSK